MKIAVFLRAVNVAKRTVKMAELKDVCERNGFSNVQTYLQSGNLVIETDCTVSETKQILESVFLQSFGFQIPLIVRTTAEIQQLVLENPFPEVKEGNLLYVTMFAQEISQNARQISLPCTGSEQFVWKECNGYLVCPEGYGKTKMTNALLEKKTGCTATTRNWNTILAIQNMLTNT